VKSGRGVGEGSGWCNAKVHCTRRRGREGLSRGGAEGAEGKARFGGGSVISAAPRAFGYGVRAVSSGRRWRGARRRIGRAARGRDYAGTDAAAVLGWPAAEVVQVGGIFERHSGGQVGGHAAWIHRDGAGAKGRGLLERFINARIVCMSAYRRFAWDTTARRPRVWLT